MSLNSRAMYPGAVLVWQVDVNPANEGTSLWQGSNLTSGSLNGGPPRAGAPLTVKLYVEHGGLTTVTVQRGIGRVAAAAGVTQAATFPVAPGPASWPAEGCPAEIMVGEPIIVRTSGLAVVAVRVLAVVVATMPGEGE